MIGGRDALHRGSWLAIARNGRFAAVTNLRGAVRDPRKRSRGELVSNFVRGRTSPREYIDEVASRRDEYAGFHLIAGDARGEVFGTPPHRIEGIEALSNAPPGERWPKMDVAEAEMRRLVAIGDVDDLVREAMRFLASRIGEVFIASDRYGTRSSTVIVASADRIVFAEQSFARGGVPDGDLYSLAFPMT